MSIAELIMTGTNRASESTAWVGDSLAKLGQNVGQALAQREQQKQAQEMLPFLQQSMQESMTLAGSGKTGEAYAKLMPFLADPSVAQNPFLKQVIPAFESGIKMAGDQFYKKEELRIREDMYGAKSDYQNLLLGLKEKQAAAKAEVDNRRLAILENKNNLMWQRNQTQDENEKARIDNELQRLDLDERRLDADIAYRQQKLGSGQDTSFQQSYEGAAGIGGPRASIPPSEQRSIAQDAQNAVANSYPLPEETPEQPTGIPAMGASETPAIPFTLESPAASFTQLGEKPYEPSERLLEAFAKNFDKYNAASPKKKKQMDSERSIVYDNLEELQNDLPSFNTDQIGFMRVDAGAVDPDLYGIKYMRLAEKARNAEGKITAYEKSGAEESIAKLQQAFTRVNNRQDLRELYTNAGGWQNVEIKGVPSSGGEVSKKPESYEVINTKNREQKVLVTKEDADLLLSIQMVVPTSNASKMDKIYLKEKEPSATQVSSQQQMSREDQIKKAQELLGATAGAKATQKELSLEERLSQKTSQATSTPAKTVTPQQQAQVAKSQAASKISTLRSEKTKLERLIYDVSRASGKSSLKRGLAENDPDVIAVKKRISEIDKELE